MFQKSTTKSAAGILPIIVLAQFLCTSLWFAGNAVVTDMVNALHLRSSFLAHLTSAIQFGFITGTLVFALFTVADRYSPSLVFFVSALLAAAFNACITIPGMDAYTVLVLRMLTGFFLAGIYPVGMKIAADYFETGLGKSLGFLVGALVLGTAFPHLLKNFTTALPWKYVLYATSVLSVGGGVLMLVLVPDGPFRKKGQQLKWSAFLHGFRIPAFRSVAFGYFGHMWELYTFWAFVPVMLAAHNMRYPYTALDIPFWSFLIIGAGSMACVAGGLLSQTFGAKKVATIALALSFGCCLLSPLFLTVNRPALFLGFLFFWGLVVIADSPLLSSLVARHAPQSSRGTSLTIVNCIGFSITIISIQLVQAMSTVISATWLYWLLAPGPLLGLMALLKKEKPVG